jgi:hypothetical protein
MKILYFDLNDRDLIEPYFDYDHYGGGCIFLRAAFQVLPDIYLAAREECFERCPESLLDRKVVLSEQDIIDIRQGRPIVELMGEGLLNQFDLIVHHFSQIWINTTGLKCKSCHWNVGYRDPVHPLNKHVLLFDVNNQSPIFQSNDHSIYQVVIGPKIPPFQEYEKEDYIFCCGRLTNSYQSIQIAQLARKYEIPIVFSGPIDRDYPFLDYLSDYTTYLGIVDNQTKIKYYEKSKLSCQMMNYNISITLSMKEGAARGQGCLCTPVGQYRTWLKPEYNGYFVTSEQDFVKGWENRDLLLQENCYNSILEFSEDKMIKSFVNAFKQVLSI